jgi:hypothetical protein
MPNWRIKRGDVEFEAADTAELQAWAQERRVVESDYVYNEMLQRWMYALEIAELSGTFGVIASTAKLETVNRMSWGFFLFGILLCFLYPPAGVVCAVIGVVMGVYYLIATGRAARGCMVAAVTVGGIAALCALVVFGMVGWRSAQARKATAAEEATEAPTATKGETVTATAIETTSSTSPPPTPEIDGRTVVTGGTDQQASQPASTTIAAAATRPPAYPQVFIDQKTLLYYSEDCPRRQNTIRTPKAMAIMRGYRPARGCEEEAGVPEQVYVDVAARTYVRENCDRRAANAVRMPKMSAIAAGYAQSLVCGANATLTKDEAVVQNATSLAAARAANAPHAVTAANDTVFTDGVVYHERGCISVTRFMREIPRQTIGPSFLTAAVDCHPAKTPR